MRIAFDITPIADKQSGHAVRGAGFYIQNLVEALEAVKGNNEIVYFTRDKAIPSGVDVVHYPYFEPFFRTLSPSTSPKTIVTVHDLTPLVFPRLFPVGLKGKARWYLQRHALKKTHAVITDSYASKQDIEKIGTVDPQKIFVIPLAASSQYKKIKTSEKEKKELLKKYNLPEVFALYVGDVTPNKNLPRLLEAIQIAGVPLVLVGKAITQKGVDATNPWNKDLVTVQKKVAHSHLFFPLGFIPTEDIVILYNLAAVAVLPSLYEGFGLPVLEAMACGCPVITTQGGSLPEVAEDAAVFVDPTDIRNIAEGIRTVLSKKTVRDECIQKGFHQSKKFSWEETARKTLQVYEEVISK